MMRLLRASVALRYFVAGLAGLAFMGSALVWIRHDAAERRERDLRASHYSDRVMRIEEGRRHRDEIEALDTDRLRERLQRWLRP